MPPLGDEPSELDTGFTEATIQTVCPAANDVETIRHVIPQNRMEEENPYLLVVMILIKQLSLGSVSDDLRESSAAPPGGNTFWSPHMAAILSGLTRAVSYPGATMKELEEGCRKPT